MVERQGMVIIEEIQRSGRKIKVGLKSIKLLNLGGKRISRQDLPTQGGETENWEGAKNTGGYFAVLWQNHVN